MSVEPVRKEMVVNASQERCFRVFTARMDDWWPREHHIGKSPLKRVVVDDHPGGRWYAICEDGSEVETGKVLVWEPPQRLVLSWQITAKWSFDPNLHTEVEVRFVPIDDKRTRVELEHRKLEAYGADAAAMKATFDKDDAWIGLLRSFGGRAEGAD